MASIVWSQDPMPRMSSQYVRGHILAAMNKISKQILADLNSTTRTWSHPVKFNVRFRFSGGNVRTYFSTSDRAWNVLNKGSGPRWALMSKGYKSKTVPGWVGSRSGSGHRVLVGKEAMQKAGHGAQPPIEARNWNAAIANKNRQMIVSEIAKATWRGVRAGIR